MRRISSVTSITSLSDLMMPSNSDSRQSKNNISTSNNINNSSAVFVEDSLLFQELKDHLKERQCTTSASIHAETQKFMKLHQHREASAADAGDADTRGWASTSVLEESCHSRNKTGSRRKNRRASDGSIQLQKLKQQQQEQQQGSSVDRFRRAVSLGFSRRMSNAFSVSSATADLSNSHHSSGASLSFLNNSSNHNSSTTFMNLAGDREEEYISASIKSEPPAAVVSSYYNSSSLSSHSTSSDVASHNNVHHRHGRRSTMDTIASTTSTDSNGNNGISGDYDDEYNASSRRRSCIASLPSQDRIVLTDDPLNPDVTAILGNTLGYEESLPLPTSATIVAVNNQEQAQVEIENVPDYYQNKYQQAQPQVEYEQEEEVPSTPPIRQRTQRRGSCVTTMLQQKPPVFAPDSIACPENPSNGNYQAEMQGREGGESPSYYYGNQQEPQEQQPKADQAETSQPRRSRRNVRRGSCTASSDYLPPPATELRRTELSEQQAEEEDEKERQLLYPSYSSVELPSSSQEHGHEDSPRSRGGRTQRRGSCVTSMMHQQPPIITKDCDRPIIETISLVPSTLDHDVQYGDLHYAQAQEDIAPPQRKGRRAVRRGSHVGSYKPPTKSEERDSIIILGEELGELLVNFGNHSSDDDTDSDDDGNSECNGSDPLEGSTGTSTSAVEEDDIVENTNEDGLLCDFPSRARKTKAAHCKNDHAFAA